MRLSESIISRGLPTFLGMMFACLNPLNAQSTQGVPRDILSPEAQLSLVGDATPTMILPLWETVLNNLDGYQNNNSIAVSGGTVYVCVNHIDPIETGEERSTIFIAGSMQTMEANCSRGLLNVLTGSGLSKKRPVRHLERQVLSGRM